MRSNFLGKAGRDAADVIGMSTAIDADRNAQSGYIAKDDQTKPEMLTQPITLRISSASRSKTRTVAVMGALKLLATPAVAFVLAKLLNLPPLAAGVVALFAAMPTGANAYIFAAQYQRLVNPVSGAVALGTLRAAVTLPLVMMVVAR
ncbi:putative permease [Bradyrhizobium japonicum]|uniref:AEC family transporter n=3 Tax=Nitrobacteraceae TaxID=41294 RepID=UPI0020A18C7B|nr:AEC family transporter [Bradyrhizobium japonicum]MCP1960375.1 putative permease [Bradyrhizobium japonicum]